MYIIISIFMVYAFSIIAYEYKFFTYGLVAVFVILIWHAIKSRKLMLNIVLISFVGLSFVNCYYNSKSTLTQYIDKEIEFTVVVNSQKKASSKSDFNSFYGSVLSVGGKKLNHDENVIIYANKEYNIKLNTVISTKGNVSQVTLGKNNLLFNYKNYLREKKIYSSIFLTDDVKVLRDNYSVLNGISIGFKSYAIDLFKSNMNEDNADMVLSMILGDVSFLDDEFYDSIKVMGLAHVFAVSGLHIGLLYGTFLKFFKIVGVSRRCSWILTWALLWSYGFLIGFPLSVMRTLLMFTFMFGSEVLYRRYNSINSIILAGLILLVINPFWLFSAGAQLSFSAALSLIIYSRFISQYISTQNKILRTLYMYLFLQLFTMPIIAYYFNYIPVMGILYNLVLVPIFTVILIISFVILMLGWIWGSLFAVVFMVLNFLLYTLRAIISIANSLAFNGIIVKSMSIYEIMFFYAFIGFMIYCFVIPKGKCKYLGCSVILSFYVLNFVIMPMYDTCLYLNLVDVGQGMFTVISYKDYSFIYDCGSNSYKDVGEYTVLPYLVKSGIKRVDGLFVSHWDADHFSGVENILEDPNIELARIFTSNKNYDINVEQIVLKNGDYINIDDRVNMRFLWPDDRYDINSINNSSLVTIISYGETNILLPGDIEEYVENIIYSRIDKSSIVIVPHHGSKTSSTESFVKAVSCDYALMSYGRNSYGIPSSRVTQRYESIGSKVLSTFYEGEINFVLNNDKIYYNTNIGNKSPNYYELYFLWIKPNGVLFAVLICLLVAMWFKSKDEVNLDEL